MSPLIYADRFATRVLEIATLYQERERTLDSEIDRLTAERASLHDARQRDMEEATRSLLNGLGLAQEPAKAPKRTRASRAPAETPPAPEAPAAADESLPEVPDAAALQDLLKWPSALVAAIPAETQRLLRERRIAFDKSICRVLADGRVLVKGEAVVVAETVR